MLRVMYVHISVDVSHSSAVGTAKGRNKKCQLRSEYSRKAGSRSIILIEVFFDNA